MWPLWRHARNAHFWSFEDENSWVAEVSSDCVNYMSGHIDTKYLDQAFWFHGWMTASQKSKKCHVRNNGIAQKQYKTIRYAHLQHI